VVVAEIDQQLTTARLAGKQKIKQRKKTKNKTEQLMEAMGEALCSGPVCVDYMNERMTVLSIDASKGELVVRRREFPMIVSTSIARHMKIMITQ